MTNKGEPAAGKAGKQKSLKKTVRGRGRPKLPDGERGTYEFVLLPRTIINKVDLLSEKNSTIAPELLHSYVDAFDENEEVSEYYWRLVFTYSVYQAVHNLFERNVIKSENIGITEIARLLKVNTSRIHISSA